jgi:predicted branched-subunit amino acid permease
VTTFIINIRYFLMSLSVSQKVDKGFQTKERLITSFGVTDEVFAVSMQRRQELTFFYMLGLIIPPIIGWSLGTVIGAVATSLLPEILTDAMGIMLYGMFIAIIVPPAREHRSVLTVIILAVVASYAFAYLPGLKQISGGWAIIIITLVVSGIGAFLFPVEDESEKHEALAEDKEGA